MMSGICTSTLTTNKKNLLARETALRKKRV